MLKKAVEKELLQIKDKKYVNLDVWNKFWERLHNNSGLIKSDNLEDHFSTFFMPIDIKHSRFYLCHHKKAQAWIPPGGHIDPDETPMETVRREFAEELDYCLDKEEVSFFDITITPIDDPKLPCNVHWDLWYVVKFESSPNFKYDQREFYQAGWFEKAEALKLSRIIHCKEVLEKAIDQFKL